MSANALLVSRDDGVQMVVPAVLIEARIETEITTDVPRAIRLLQERKFEAVIVDYDMEGADAVLKDIDLYPSNRTAVAFAIVHEEDGCHGLPPGAKFIMAKPVLAEQARRTLRAASGLLVGEYRRYFRCALEVPIHLTAASREFRAKTTNVSMGGLALRTLQLIGLAEKFRLEFVLPQGGTIETDGEVVWADTQGRAGMHFLDLPTVAQKRLQTWLDSKRNKGEVDR
jgi:DNA-binding response OmpR family regulator